MFHEPKTRAEAAAYRYGRWAGKPFGNGYDHAKCAAEVADGWMHKQCAKKPGHGPDALYCKTHEKMIKAANVQVQGASRALSRSSPGTQGYAAKGSSFAADHHFLSPKLDEPLIS